VVSGSTSVRTSRGSDTSRPAPSCPFRSTLARAAPRGRSAVPWRKSADADARAFLVKITLPDTAGLRSGTFGRAHFSALPRRALIVPAGALVHRGQVTSVFVVEKDIARLRLVNVSGTEVLAGLSEGETVIVAAPPTVTDGRPVAAGGR
jgi:hypothetical protein